MADYLCKRWLLPAVVAFAVNVQAADNQRVVVAQTPVAAAVESVNHVPDWFSEDVDNVRIGAGAPSVNPATARTHALFNAVLTYLRATDLGVIHLAGSVFVSNRYSSLSVARSVTTQQVSDVISYEGFACDVLHEARNQQGEHFIRCSFAPKGRPDNTLLVQRNWLSTVGNEAPHSRVAKVRMDLHLNGQSHTMEFTLEGYRDEAQVTQLTIDGDKLPLTPVAAYPKRTLTQSPLPRPLQFTSTDLRTSLGIIQTAICTLTPFVPAAFHTNSSDSAVDYLPIPEKQEPASQQFYLRTAISTDTVSLPVNLRLSRISKQGLTATVGNVRFDDSRPLDSADYCPTPALLHFGDQTSGYQRLLLVQEQLYLSLNELALHKASVSEVTPLVFGGDTDEDGNTTSSVTILSADHTDVGVRWDFQPAPPAKQSEKLVVQALKQGRFSYPIGICVKAR